MRIALIISAAMLSLLLAACGDDRRNGEAGPTVVATTAVAADIVQSVAGEDAEVVQLVPDGASPHTYAPSARDRDGIESADLFVYFDPALETALSIGGSERSFAIAEHAGRLRPFERPRTGTEEQNAYEGAKDPHVWLDPTAIARSVPALAQELAAIDPANAAAYRRRAREYDGELARLDDELARTARTIPERHRVLITSHESLGYFADRYGFDLLGSAFGASPGAEAGARDVAALSKLIEQRNVPVVFAQQGDDPELLQRIADETGVAVVDDLLVSDFGGRVDSYPAMMRWSADRIASALRG